MASERDVPTRPVAVMLAIAGIIHLLPLPGVLGGEWLQRLYGSDALDPGLELLLRHRAVLFALLAGVLMLAARRARLVPLALVAGLLSTLAFLLLAGDPRMLSPPLLRVWVADVLAIACLGCAAVLSARQPQ